MTVLIIAACLALLAVIVVQIGRLTELAAKIRGEEEVQYMTNRRNASFGMVFLVLFLVGCIGSALYYKNYLLGYGPHSAASAHGAQLDDLFQITLFFTGIVFVLTQIALFWFAFKYQGTKDGKSEFISHDNKLEVIWTVIPAVVMVFLVVSGLFAWNEVMADTDPTDVPKLVPAADSNEYLEIEATGYQFAWDIRYPGEDGKLGEKNFRLISPGSNPLGQNWEDRKNIDDFMPLEIYLPVGREVRVRITSKDVLHNFYLPHFRVKMDAIPGLPTYFRFTPEVTTEEYRERLKNTPEYNIPDPDDATKMKWETFDYELACAELCGRSHFSMKRIVKVVSEEEYREWISKQQSLYKSSIRGTKDDPFIGEVLPYEIADRRISFNEKVEAALEAENDSLKIVRLEHVNFETGSARLTSNSKYELQNVVDFLN
ncbi:MAG: cytochrome c oxidase subunit II, partial [Bacteroidota bacterium]